MHLHFQMSRGWHLGLDEGKLWMNIYSLGLTFINIDDARAGIWGNEMAYSMLLPYSQHTKCFRKLTQKCPSQWSIRRPRLGTLFLWFDSLFTNPFYRKPTNLKCRFVSRRWFKGKRQCNDNYDSNDLSRVEHVCCRISFSSVGISWDQISRIDLFVE